MEAPSRPAVGQAECRSVGDLWPWCSFRGSVTVGPEWSGETTTRMHKEMMLAMGVFAADLTTS